MEDARSRPPPAERFDVPSVVFDLRGELAALRAEPGPARQGHRQKTLFRHADRTVALFDFEPGGTMPEHMAAGTVTIEPVEGEIEVTVNGSPRTLRPGQILVMSPGVKHAVTSGAGGVFLLQISLAR